MSITLAVTNKATFSILTCEATRSREQALHHWATVGVGVPHQTLLAGAVTPSDQYGIDLILSGKAFAATDFGASGRRCLE